MSVLLVSSTVVFLFIDSHIHMSYELLKIQELWTVKQSLNSLLLKTRITRLILNKLFLNYEYEIFSYSLICFVLLWVIFFIKNDLFSCIFQISFKTSAFFPVLYLISLCWKITLFESSKWFINWFNVHLV